MVGTKRTKTARSAAAFATAWTLSAVFLGGCGATTTERLNLPRLETVEHVELPKYLGTWYEIARYPQSFQEGCVASTATYELREDGEISVVNRCRKDTLDGEQDSAEGRARVVDPGTNAKLEVTFFWPFWGDYWIIDLDEDYQWAVVGHPSRDYLWILSRTPRMDDATYAAILERLQKQGYPLDRLLKTLQPDNAPPMPVPAAFSSSVHHIKRFREEKIAIVVD